MTTFVYIADGAILTASASTQGNTVNSLTRRIIKSASLTNTTASPVACSVYLIPSGGTAGAANTFIVLRAIASGETYNCPELIGKGLNAGGFVQALGAGVSFAYSASDVV